MCCNKMFPAQMSQFVTRAQTSCRGRHSVLEFFKDWLLKSKNCIMQLIMCNDDTRDDVCHIELLNDFSVRNNTSCIYNH